MGAWRALRTAAGERPVDIAARLHHDHLVEALTPIYRREVPLDALKAVQTNFHQVIERRITDLPSPHGLRLPELEPLLEIKGPGMWFPVPEMYGGFSFWLARAGADPLLVSESWCRVVGGSGQRHEVTVSGSSLVADGIDL